MELRRLRESFLNGPVVDRNGYPYFVAPLSDGVPRIDRGLLEEAVDGLAEVAELDCDLILAPEAMGIPLAAGLTLKTGIPFLVIRKKPYGLPGEIVLDQRTGYSKATMYIDTVEPGERVAIVDDVVDTGGTLRATVRALMEAGVVVTEVAVVFNRSPDVDALSREIGVPIRYLLTVGTEDGRPVIRPDS
ncbi:MAG: adenine phosphoribosyltransferase [Thermoplasmata archaeon]|nr:adenine phosphoribosyltransferase [Thermoplasmata archaeon]